MSEYSPPSIPPKWAVSIGVGYILLLGYSLIITGEVFVFAVIPAMFLLSLYIVWRFLVAVEAMADAFQRIASQREQD